MQIEMKVPQLSESVSEATLLTWHKQAGEAVKEGENLIDVETDKVVLELPAPKDGVLIKIIKQNGEKVGSGEVIALLDTEAVAGCRRKAASAAAAARLRLACRQRANWRMSKMWMPASLQGSGRHGVVTKEDVLAAAAKRRWLPFRKPLPEAASSSACR